MKVVCPECRAKGDGVRTSNGEQVLGKCPNCTHVWVESVESAEIAEITGRQIGGDGRPGDEAGDGSAAA